MNRFACNVEIKSSAASYPSKDL